MAKKRNKYTEEFKRDAVRLMRNRGERTVAQVADDLGVPTNQLHRPMAGTSAGCGCLGGLLVGAGVAASVTGSFAAVGSSAEWLLAVAIIGVSALVGARLAARYGERFWLWLWELIGWWP